MGLWSWFRSLDWGARRDRAPVAPEDPLEALDRAYRRQLEVREQVRQTLAEVAAGAAQVQMQVRQLEATLDRLEERARAEVATGDEVSAGRTLRRRAVLREQLAELEGHRERLAGEEAASRGLLDRLDLEVERFRLRVEAIKASDRASRSKQDLGEWLGSGEDFELKLALSRAQDSIMAGRARADAVDRLLARGWLGDASLAPDAFLEEVTDSAADAEAKQELARIRRELT